MKKLLAVAVVSIFSLSCMAGLFHDGHSWQKRKHTISINNKTDATVDVSDKDNHKITVDSHQTAQMDVTVHEPEGGLRILRLKVTTITVESDNGSSSIEIDENTKSVTVGKELKLSKNDSNNRNDRNYDRNDSNNSDDSNNN